MKCKYLWLFILSLVFIHSGSTSAETFLEPEWSEFCPPKYVNLNSEKNYLLAEKKYWLNRKADFKNKKSYCASLGTAEKSQCWGELKIQEINKTNAFYAQKQLEEERTYNAILYQAVTK